MSAGLTPTLMEGGFATRHRFLLVLMWIQVPAIAAAGLAAGEPTYEVGLASLSMMAFALAGLVFSGSRLASLTVSVGLLTASFVLVDYLDGVTFSHAYFFLMITAISFYRDRVVLAVGVVAVAVFHLIAAIERPVDPLAWTAIHSGAIAALALLLMAGWRLTGAIRANPDDSGVRFRTSFERAPIGMAVLKPSGEFLEVNRSMAQILGYEQDSFVGVNVSSLVHPDDQEELGAAWEQMGNTAEHTATEWMRWLTASGNPIWARVSLVLVTWTRAQPAMVIVQIEEASHAHEEQRRLESLLRGKDEFVAAIGNEIRQPLGLLIDLTANPDGDADRTLPRIEAHAREIASVVDDLVVSARSGTTPVSVVAHTLDAGELCREIVSGIPGAVNVSVETHATRLWADPSLTRQIVNNLVGNAVRYGGPDIRVKTLSSGPDTVIQVTDNGPEIPSAERTRLFNGDLRNGQPVTSPAAVGLSLTVGRSLARLMDGEVEYRRSPEGANVFELRLPSEQFTEVPQRIPA